MHTKATTAGLVLLSVLLAPTSLALQPQENGGGGNNKVIDLSGIWQNQSGELLQIEQSGVQFRARFKIGGACQPSGDARESYLQGTIQMLGSDPSQGASLSGQIKRCDNAYLVEHAGHATIWNTTFKGDVRGYVDLESTLPDSEKIDTRLKQARVYAISGTWTAQHWGYSKREDGTPYNFRKEYDYEEPWSLTRVDPCQEEYNQVQKLRYDGHDLEERLVEIQKALDQLEEDIEEATDVLRSVLKINDPAWISENKKKIYTELIGEHAKRTLTPNAKEVLIEAFMIGFSAEMPILYPLYKGYKKIKSVAKPAWTMYSITRGLVGITQADIDRMKALQREYDLESMDPLIEVAELSFQRSHDVKSATDRIEYLLEMSWQWVGPYIEADQALEKAMQELEDARSNLETCHKQNGGPPPGW